MADWFAQNAPEQGGWFAQNAPSPQSGQKPVPKTWSDQLAIEHPAARGLVDFAEGLASGASSTVFHGGDLLRRATGMERILDKPDVQQAMTAPDSLPGRTGKFVEQGAEFLIPGMAVSKGMKGASAVARIAADTGLAAGISGLQTGGDLEAMAEAGATAGGLTGVGAALAKTGAAAKTAEFLQNSAVRQYGRAIGATGKGNKWLSKNEVVPGLLERGVTASSPKALQSKAAGEVARLGQAIEGEWTNLPPGTATELQPLYDRLTQMADEAFTVAAPNGAREAKGPVAQHGLNQFQRLQQTLLNVAEVNPQTGQLQVPVEQLRKLKQYFDGIAAKAGRFEGANLADASAAEVHGMFADAVRQEFAKDFPDIAAINKEFSFWKDVHKVTSETVLSREGQARPGLLKKAAPAIGAAIGAAGGAGAAGIHGGISGAALGKYAGDMLAALSESGSWRTASAVQKNKLAGALVKGNRGEVEFWLRKMVKAAALEMPTALSLEGSSGIPAALPAR